MEEEGVEEWRQQRQREGEEEEEVSSMRPPLPLLLAVAGPDGRAEGGRAPGGAHGL